MNQPEQPDEQRVNDAVQSGWYASKGAARRAMGIEPVRYASESAAAGAKAGMEWVERLTAGLAGRRPATPANRCRPTCRCNE